MWNINEKNVAQSVNCASWWSGKQKCLKLNYLLHYILLHMELIGIASSSFFQKQICILKYEFEFAFLQNALDKPMYKPVLITNKITVGMHVCRLDCQICLGTIYLNGKIYTK
jgi:hypothetical protein